MNKGYFIIGVSLFFSMLIFPLAATGDNSDMISTAKAANATVIANNITTTADNNQNKIRVYLHNEKRTVDVDLLEYLTGVVAAEIEPSYETEAIKAQAVAAHTLMIFKKSENNKQGYDISDNSAVDQGYIDKNDRQKKWGDDFSKYESRVKDAIGKVLNKTITYKSKPILAVYCDTSGGKTESAKNIWGGDYPYLVPVESISDMLSPNYISTVTYTKEEFSAMAQSLKVNLSNDSSKWIGKSTCSDSGTVLKIKIGDKELSGTKIREAFVLRSANFDLEQIGGKFVFTVRGYGHGVGMSQFGANYMAKGGSKYDEILKWYYSGCEISG